jgi:large subunit ribosomal protein L21
MKFAIIKTGGKQYKVKEGDVFQVEKLNVEEDGKLIFDKVLLKGDGDDIEVGQPYLKNLDVEAEVIKHGKGDKKIIFRYKPKKRYRKKTGHRQPYTEVKVINIK